MFLSDRVNSLSESITLKLNALATELTKSGKKVYNLTAGQLPFKPFQGVVDGIGKELDNLASFQYSPAAGFQSIRNSVIKNIEKTRGIDFGALSEPFDCAVGNGAKNVIYNVLAAMVSPGDEVILLAPHWVSYTEMLKLVQSKGVVVSTDISEGFVPSIDEIRKRITSKTRAIVINSPNNPSGIHYSREWMVEFATLVEEHPQLAVISDEIYYELYYNGERPTYFYQFNPKLLERTIIIDGISKVLASTGLRIGYCIGPKHFIAAVAKIQGQTASGASSLIQRALEHVDLENTDTYLTDIRKHLRTNAKILKSKLEESGLGALCYQSNSAFYYLIDFTQTPVFKRFKKLENDGRDHALEICQDILNTKGVAIVPGSDFGMPNSARLSLVLEKEIFSKALDDLFAYLVS